MTDLSLYAFSRPKRQEQFGAAYIQAVASAAGYEVKDVKIDEDSIDLNITQRGNPDDPEIYPYYSTLRVQSKCVSSHHPYPDGTIHYSLSRKNYDDLRRDHTADSSILVIVLIPSLDESQWMTLLKEGAL